MGIKKNQNPVYKIGFSKGESDSGFVDQRSHRYGAVGAGCHDSRTHTNSRLHDDGPLVARAGPATAAVAAADHDYDEKNKAANRSSLAGIVHFMPPCKDT